MSVLSDGIGDRDIPGATAQQLVDVSTFKACSVLFISLAFIVWEENVMVEGKAWVFIVLFCGE